MKALTEKPQLVAGISFLVLVIFGLIIAGFRVSQWLEDEQKAPIQQIMLSGERHEIRDADVEALVRKQFPQSFFLVDVNEVHLALEQMPWVYQASVRKRWPNSLKVYLVEQVPVAIWNDDGMLNQYGDTFDAKAKDESLPRLFGPEGTEKTALQGYRAMQSLLAGAGLQVQELSLSERFAWHLRLSNEISLNLGRSEFIDRLQRFIDVYPMLKKADKDIDYVDLRYDTGLAVGWKNTANNQQQQS